MESDCIESDTSKPFFIFNQLNLLWWHWFIKSYRFQVQFNKASPAHLHTAWWTYLHKQRFFPSPSPRFAHLHPASLVFSLWPLPHCCLCLCVMYTCFLANSFNFHQFIPPPPLWQLSVCSMYPCLCFYFVILFCSLDSIYMWDLMISVLLWLAYFT